MLRHKMKMHCICSRCISEQANYISLTSAKEGQRLLIKQFKCGKRACMRLINMGIRQGDQIKVIKNSGHGQLVIAIDHARFLLGRGISEKIWGENVI
jgi:Fe2+ transport system protein FeoA